jgi:DNA-3-methyladenine glycosylase I
VLFERLCLEVNQAGLSWLTVLKKRAAFQAAFRGFVPETVAKFGARDVARLMKDEGIIRNRLKIDSSIDNAGRFLRLEEEHGSFDAWLDAHHPLEKDEWVKLFRKTFRFMGPEIVNEFLMSIGYLPGAHPKSCPVFAVIAKRNPPWMRARK